MTEAHNFFLRSNLAALTTHPLTRGGWSLLHKFLKKKKKRSLLGVLTHTEQVKGVFFFVGLVCFTKAVFLVLVQWK